MATTPRPRARCRTCGCNATKTWPLRNGYCSDACATTAILHRA